MEFLNETTPTHYSRAENPFSPEQVNILGNSPSPIWNTIQKEEISFSENDPKESLNASKLVYDELESNSSDEFLKIATRHSITSMAEPLTDYTSSKPPSNHQPTRWKQIDSNSLTHSVTKKSSGLLGQRILNVSDSTKGKITSLFKGQNESL